MEIEVSVYKTKDGKLAVLALFILSLIVTVIGGGVTVVKSAYEKITLQAEAKVLVSTLVSQVTLSDIEMESKEVVNGFVSTASISLSNIFMTNMKMTGTNGLNGFADHLGGATVKQIELFNIQMISESEVNPFVQSAGGTSLSNISMKKLIIQDSNGTTEEDFEIP